MLRIVFQRKERMNSFFVAGVIATIGAVANPCANVEKGSYTVTNCWDCFQKLLNDCDNVRPNDDNTPSRRQACYTGANNFFTFCLGKVGGGPGRRTTPIQAPDRLTLGEGYIFNVAFASKPAADRITVYVRSYNGTSTVQQPVKAWVLPANDGSLDVMIDDTTLDLSDDTSIGVIVAVRDSNDRISDAVATVATVDNPLDANRDGTVDAADTIELWNMYANNTISYEVFVERSQKIVK